MKQVELTDKNYSEIKSTAIANWVVSRTSDNSLVMAVIDSFIGFCNKNNYVVQDGKVLHKNEEKQERNK